MSRVPMGPPPSSTGTLNPAQTRRSARTRVISPTGVRYGVVHGRRPGAGEGVHAGTLAEDLLIVLDGLAQLVGGAGPAQLAVGMSQHDPGGVNVEELLGRHHGVLQGLGQVALGGGGRSGCRCSWPASTGGSA